MTPRDTKSLLVESPGVKILDSTFIFTDSQTRQKPVFGLRICEWKIKVDLLFGPVN